MLSVHLARSADPNVGNHAFQMPHRPVPPIPEIKPISSASDKNTYFQAMKIPPSPSEHQVTDRTRGLLRSKMLFQIFTWTDVFYQNEGDDHAR